MNLEIVTRSVDSNTGCQDIITLETYQRERSVVKTSTPIYSSWLSDEVLPNGPGLLVDISLKCD